MRIFMMFMEEIRKQKNIKNEDLEECLNNSLIG